jgi:Protein of unknown function (DUF3352)
MKFRSFLLILVASSLILLLIAGTSLSWILQQSPLYLRQGGILQDPMAAMFIPRQAPVMLSLIVNPEQLEALQKLSISPGERQRSHWEFQRIKKSLLASTGLNYQKEIQPWLGDEITLAVTSLDYDRNAENGLQPGYLLAVKTENANLAREFLQVSYSKSAIAGTSELVFEQYKGVKIIYKKPLIPQVKQGISATAVVGDFVLFANHPKVLFAAINNVQVPDLNLKDSASYQSALRTITTPRIGVAVINLPTLSAWITNTPVPENPEIEQFFTLALALNSQGLIAQTALIGVSGTENQNPALAAPVNALNYIPETALFTAAGTNLNQFWTQIATGLPAESPLYSLLNQALNRIQEPLGLTLPEDIFPWVQGEYALALISNPETQQLDWLFVTEKTDNMQANTAIQKLDELAENQGLSVGELPLFNDKNMTAWTQLKTTPYQKKLVSLDAQVKGVHTNIDRYEIFSTSIETLSQAVTTDKVSLLNSEKFQQAITSLPIENDGYFYADWQAGQATFKELPIIRFLEVFAQPLFEHLKTFTANSQGSLEGIRRATLFFDLK